MTRVASGAPRARVVALSSRASPRGGLGRAVLEAVQRRGPPEGVELCEVEDAAGLLASLRLSGPVVLVDALIGGIEGEVRVLEPDELATTGLAAASTPGLSIAGALALARFLAPAETSRDVKVVGVATGTGRAFQLGPLLSGAVERAAEMALELTRA